MAIRQFDLAPPADRVKVVKAAGSSIGTALVRVTIDDANTVIVNGKNEVLRCLDAIRAQIVADTWPLA